LNYSGNGSAKKKAILDTNVIYSALYKPEGVCGRIILGGTSPLVKLYSIDFALEELCTNLDLKMRLSKEPIDLIISSLSLEWIPREIYSRLLGRAMGIVRDQQDSPFVAASMATGFPLVTGDRHLLTPRVHRAIRVYKPSEFAKTLAD
jgi:predicted nucleic acid-binding protein